MDFLIKKRIRKFKTFERRKFREFIPKITPESPSYLREGMRNYYLDLERGITRRYKVPSEDLIKKYRDTFPENNVEFYLNSRKKELFRPWVMRIKKEQVKIL